jgi:hypothetical protein
VKTAFIISLSTTLLCIVALATPSGKAKAGTSSLENKINKIEANGSKVHPDPAPTVLTEDEVNAYLASGELQMPAGVKSVKLRGEDGQITGTARVDFDEVRAGVHSSNPLLSLFSGIHDVEVATHAHGEGGFGYVQVDSVSLDGVEVPRFVLQLFVDKYLTPRYPEIGLDSKFKLPDRIDSARVEEHKIVLVQK